MTLLFPDRRPRRTEGFTLVELMLAAGLGVLFCAGLFKLLLGDVRLTASMAQRLQSRRQQQRALGLMRAERDLGVGVIANPPLSQEWPCSLGDGGPSWRLPYPLMIRRLVARQLFTAWGRRRRRFGADRC